MKRNHLSMQPKENDVEKVGAASEEGKPIKSIVEKDTKISKDDAKTIQDEKNVLIKFLTAASERRLEEKFDLKKECGLSETMREAPTKPSLIFPTPVEESNSDLLISYENQSFIAASDDMKELNGSSYGMKTPEELQPKGVKSVQNPCFNEGHPPNSCQRWFVAEFFRYFLH